MNMRTAFYSIFIIMQASILVGQKKNDLGKIHVWFDNIIGQDVSGLYNGALYLSNVLVSKENHPFFKSPDFVQGRLEYDGQKHYQVPLKYNLLSDDIIISPKNTSGSLSLRLIKSKVKSFLFEGHEFVQVSPKYYKTKENLGFCEVILKNDAFGLYKKHTKKGKKVSKKGKVSIEFEMDHLFYLYKRDEFHRVNNKRELIQLFPEQKALINDYYKSYKELQKSAPDQFMKSILEPLYTLLTPETAASK